MSDTKPSELLPGHPESPGAAGLGGELPDYRPWSLAAVRLLQEVVYAEETTVWNEVVSCRSHLESFFARLGLVPVVDEPNGYAYLRQLDGELDGLPPGYEKLPKLLRRSRLGYDASLMCVLLREELRRFEEEEVDSERCVVEEPDLFIQWQRFFPPKQDEQKQYKDYLRILKSVAEMGFARLVSKDPPAWEIRRILKARLDARALESLLGQLAEKRGEQGNH